ncbi:MAG: spore coat U domain-containing protein [Pseudomonadota bacterium]|nr:spore coat U domain-containing protein [Pseudomonadota bacterium]
MSKLMKRVWWIGAALLCAWSMPAHAVRCQVLIGGQSAAVINLPDIVPTSGGAASSRLNQPLGLRCGRFAADFDSGDYGLICLTLSTGSGGSNGQSRTLAPVGNPAATPIPFAMYRSTGTDPWSWTTVTPSLTNSIYFKYRIDYYSGWGFDSNYSQWTPYPGSVTVGAGINVTNDFDLTPGTYSSHLEGSVYAVARTSIFNSCENTLRGEPFSITVNATVKSNCRVTTSQIPDLSFGPQSQWNAEHDATTAFAVQCTKTTPYRIGLDAGQNAVASQRRMKWQGGADYIRYDLYQDAGRNSLWGNTTAAPSDTVSGIGTGAARDYTVFGRVPAGQNPAAGDYLDRVTITVSY